MTILGLIDTDAARGGRYPCPLCGSSRGLSVSPDEGDTGVAHCFSCQWGGTGAQLYAATHHVEMHEALRAFGVAEETGAQRRLRKARRRPVHISEAVTEAQAHLLEIERARLYWTDAEQREYAFVCRMMRERRRNDQPTGAHEYVIEHLVQRALNRARVEEDAVRRAESELFRP
jgi:hypothetical protein